MTKLLHIEIVVPLMI